MSSPPPQPGGFILSPPASSVTSTATYATKTLPHPRGTSLRPGGSKESAFIRYADQQILHIQRRFAKRTTPDPVANNGDVPDRDLAAVWDSETRGYRTMMEACKSIEELVGVIWVSGTPSLQVPYLINLALLLTTVVAGMPPTPKSLFRLLGKLDHAFASLLQGRDMDSGERLPGFEGRKGVSGTEKVRIRSLVERTRLSVMEAFRAGEFDDEPEEPEEEDGLDPDRMDTDADLENGELVLEGSDHVGMEEEEASLEMQIARVYDRTIVELGGSLEAPSIGVLTEARIRTAD